jgi:hypothetical protein
MRSYEMLLAPTEQPHVLRYVPLSIFFKFKSDIKEILIIFALKVNASQA